MSENEVQGVEEEVVEEVVVEDPADEKTCESCQ